MGIPSLVEPVRRQEARSGKIEKLVALAKPENRYQRLAFARPHHRKSTDIQSMKTTTQRLTVLCVILTGLFGLALQVAAAGECRDCRGPYGGKTTPCGETGCGPRYWGAFWDEPNCPDPCDCRNEWRGGQFKSPSLDLLAPWQLPPGKGFWTPEQCGYATEGHCHSCGHSWCPRWLTPSWWLD